MLSRFSKAGAATVVSAVVALFATSAPVQAVPFSFAYESHIVATNIPGLAYGQSAKVVYTMDNGHRSGSYKSQVWTPADVLSIKFVFNNGALVTTFSTPKYSNPYGLDRFETDARGNLTKVFGSTVYSESFGITENYSTNGTANYFSFMVNSGPRYNQANYDEYLEDPVNGYEKVVFANPDGGANHASMWEMVSLVQAPFPESAPDWSPFPESEPAWTPLPEAASGFAAKPVPASASLAMFVVAVAGLGFARRLRGT